MLLSPACDPEDQREQLERLAADVLPRFAGR
jgi:hypothetical protein